jgi:multiple sugar transport system permease protein
MTGQLTAAEEVPRRARVPRPYSIYGSAWSGWAFVGVALALLAVFVITPFLMSFALSFTNQRLVSGPVPTTFVGLRNYMRLFDDPEFWNALRNTATFAVIVVPVQSSLSLALAMLINSTLPGRNVFRTIYFLPVIITMTIICVIWGALYIYPGGAFNQLLGWISGGLIEPINWLGDRRFTMGAIILCSIWASVGFQMVIYLAGLQNIPDDLYDAARMDEASGWQQFWWITMPMLRPTHVFVVIATTIFCFKLFTQVQILTQGGPRGATDTLVRFIYVNGFSELRVGYASAATVVFVLIVLGIAMLQRAIVGREE